MLLCCVKVHEIQWEFFELGFDVKAEDETGLAFWECCPTLALFIKHEANIITNLSRQNIHKSRGVGRVAFLHLLLKSSRDLIGVGFLLYSRRHIRQYEVLSKHLFLIFANEKRDESHYIPIQCVVTFWGNLLTSIFEDFSKYLKLALVWD